MQQPQLNALMQRLLNDAGVEAAPASRRPLSLDPFGGRHHGVPIARSAGGSGGCTAFGGVNVPYSPEPAKLATPEEGFDELVVTQICNAANILAAALSYAFGSEAPVGSEPYMYLTARDVEDFIPGLGLYKARLTYRGIAGDKYAKYRFTTSCEKNSYQTVLLPGMSSMGPADVSEPRVGVTVRYVQYGVPDTSLVGTPVEPPIEPALPPFLWEGIANPVYIYPHGWVLEKRESEGVPGTMVYLVEDTYTFYMTDRPSK